MLFRLLLPLFWCECDALNDAAAGCSLIDVILIDDITATSGGGAGAFPASLPPGMTPDDFNSDSNEDDADMKDEIGSQTAIESPKSTSGDEVSSPPTQSISSPVAV